MQMLLPLYKRIVCLNFQGTGFHDAPHNKAPGWLFLPDMSKLYCFIKTQTIPTSLETAWAFFSSPSNLHHLTPAYLQLKFTNELFGDKMYPGQVITYRIRPFLGIPVFWMTEITHMANHQFFVDEQRKGPYSLWHHQHHFKEIPGGVQMTDILHYALPGGFIGHWAHQLWVGRQLKQIFDFRSNKIEALFPAVSAQPVNFTEWE